jgi:hypothetical protein
MVRDTTMVSMLLHRDRYLNAESHSRVDRQAASCYNARISQALLEDQDGKSATRQ